MINRLNLSIILTLTGASLSGCTTLPTDTYSASCPANLSCIAKGNIAVIGDKDLGQNLLRAAQKGAQKYEYYFERPISNIAIVQGASVSSELNAKLKQVGYKRALPWLAQNDRQKMRVDNVRLQILAQTQGMPKSQQDAIVKTALERLAAKPQTSQSVNMSPEEEGALTHELGHYWFMEAFQPQQQEKSSGHNYGGWAPDWLDETAAILLENDTLTKSRREALKKTPREKLYPLAEFLKMEHPALKSVQALQAKYEPSSSGESRIYTLTGKEAEEFLKSSNGDPSVFYTQVRGFIDYVLETSEDKFIHAKIATHLATGKSFESFLSTHESLPKTIHAMNLDWMKWLNNHQ